jgi:hypothetical protein
MLMTSSRRSRAWRSLRDENSLTAKLEAVVQQLGIEVPQSGSLIALLPLSSASVIGLTKDSSAKKLPSAVLGLRLGQP